MIPQTSFLSNNELRSKEIKMWVYGQTGEAKRSSRDDVGTQEKLDRALVAGLILEVVLDQPNLPPGLQARQSLVKSRLQDYLVQHLAGRVSLDRFRSLAQNLDGWIAFYYPLLVSDGQSMAAKSPTITYTAREPQSTYRVHEPQLKAKTGTDMPAPVHHACLDELLDTWLEGAKTDIPHRSHRKLTGSKLRKFLCQSAGRWFRLRDFQQFVQMDRKTAWDYLQLFLQTGLLCHNRKNSAAVRYCLAPSFLKVQADALRLAISLSLTSHPEPFIEKMSDFLIATGGEPFQLQEWAKEFPAPEHQLLLDELVDQDILVWQNLSTGSRFLKLHHRWLQPPTHASAPHAQRLGRESQTHADF
jgi:hypothetical protein